MSKPAKTSDALSGLQRAQNDNFHEFELHPSSVNDANLKLLKNTFIRWINSHTSSLGTIVRDVTEDLADGQILTIFLQGLTGETIPDMVPASSDRAKMRNLDIITKWLETNLGIKQDSERWTIAGIVKKDHVSALNLLVDITRVVRFEYILPSNITVAVIKRETVDNVVKAKTAITKVTGVEVVLPGQIALKESDFLMYSDGKMTSASSQNLVVAQSSTSLSSSQMALAADPFDALVAFPEKAAEVTRLVMAFSNKHLAQLNLAIVDVKRDFSDGVLLVTLLSLLGNFFVPLCNYKLNPESFNDRLENVKFALNLMTELGMDISRINATEIVRGETKAVLRVLHGVTINYVNM